MATTAPESQGPRKRAGEWDNSENGDDLQPPARKRQPPIGSRFAVPTSSSDLEIASKPGPAPVAVPRNTEKNDQWAARALNEWISERNQRCEEKCPVDILDTEDAESLAKWLSLFTMEVRKKSGEKYPPMSIRMMLFALQRIIRRNNKHAFSIFSHTDERFRSFQNTMESTFQNLHSEGLGVVVKHTVRIEESEEDVLWERGILGAHSPYALIRTLFYLNGLNFGLRGGREHRELKLSQFVRANGHWKYIDNSSKDSRQKREVVRQLQRVSGRSERCHFRLLDLYMSKLPEQAKAKDSFYLNPVPEMPFDPRMPWYTSVPLGRNKLNRLVKEMFSEAGIEGKTCQSLWVTASARSSQQEFPERRIEGQAEHPSTDGFIVHERLGSGQDVQGAGQGPLHTEHGRLGAGQDQPQTQQDRLGAGQDRLHISPQPGSGQDRPQPGAGQDRYPGPQPGAWQDRLHIGPQQDRPGAGQDRLHTGTQQDRPGAGQDQYPGPQPGAWQDRLHIGPQQDRSGAGQDRLHTGTQQDRPGAGQDRHPGPQPGAWQDRLHIGRQQDRPGAGQSTGDNVCEQDRTARDALAGVFQTSVELPTEVSRDEQAPAQSSSEQLSSGHFAMPFILLRNGNEQQNAREKYQRVKAHIDELKQRIERLESTAPTQLEAGAYGLASGDSLTGNQRELEIEQLENRLSGYHDIIGQQEQLQRSAEEKQNPQSKLLLLKERMLWKEQGRLEAHRESLKEQREVFELEKQKHMEAVRRLDRERQSFEDDKAAFLRDHFHVGSPRAKPGCSSRPTEG